jgi:hypothetical protein
MRSVARFIALGALALSISACDNSVTRDEKGNPIYSIASFPYMPKRVGREVVPMDIYRMGDKSRRFWLGLRNPANGFIYEHVQVDYKYCPRALEVLYPGRAVEVMVDFYRDPKTGRVSSVIDTANLTRRICRR